MEKNFERKFINELRKLPNSWWPDKIESDSIRGFPDRIGCVNGRMCALEFKKNKLEANKKTGRIVLQKYELTQIDLAGGYTAIVYPENQALVMDEIRGLL